MLNADVIDLYSRVDVGTKIIVLPNYNNLAALLLRRRRRFTPDCNLRRHPRDRHAMMRTRTFRPVSSGG